MPMTALGACAAATARSMLGESTLARPIATSATMRDREACPGAAAGRRCGVRVLIGDGGRRKKVVAMAGPSGRTRTSPTATSDAIDANDKLRCRVGRPRRTRREGRQHERQRGQRDQRREARIRLLRGGSSARGGAARRQQAQPTTPLQMIITAAKSCPAQRQPSRAPATIIETIKDTSMTVTARASTSVPKGSPTRCAMVSAW